MSKSRILAALLFTLVLAATALPAARSFPPATKEAEAKLIAVIKSDAPYKDKADACRQLSVIGGPDSIAPLAAMLADPKLNHMARYALEPNPDPAVDKVLLDALGKLKGKPLVGVIGSIGVRRDAKAVESLVALVHTTDPLVNSAAVRALGSIGNLEAAKALQAALDHAPPDNLPLYEAVFRCAENLLADGQPAEAIKMYDQVRKTDTADHQVRAGALRGAILARGKAGLPLLRENLRSEDYILFSAAAQTALELPDADVTKALTDALPELSVDGQILVAQTLGKRGDTAAVPALLELAKSGETLARLAAIAALAQAVDRPSAPVLVALLDDPDAEIRQAAKTTLSDLPCQLTYSHTLKMLQGGDTNRQLIAIELIGRQRVVDSVTYLLKVAAEGDQAVRPAAIRMIGDLSGPNRLSSLLDLLAGRTTSQDLEATRQALSAVCAGADDPQSCSKALIAAADKAKPPQKIVLLRVLSGIGGTDALAGVRRAVNDSNAEVHTAAIRALGAWQSAEAAPDLLALAKTSDNATDRTLCLRGYLSIASRRDLSVGQRLDMCRRVVDLIEGTDEKKLLLGALSGIDSPEATALIVPHLDDPATRAEAGAAVMAIAERLLKGRGGGGPATELIEPLEKVTQAGLSADQTDRAKQLLRQARNRAKRQ